MRDPISKRRGGSATQPDAPDPTVDNEATADDLSPETLLREQRPDPADRRLRHVDESSIGGGTGKDEAELAEEEPVTRARPGRSDRGPGRMHSRNAAKRTQGP